MNDSSRNRTGFSLPAALPGSSSYGEQVRTVRYESLYVLYLNPALEVSRRPVLDRVS
jgi:hypothetical protein